MTDGEAEKVINMSLCKMAESRTIRRGGSSLHKHLLISSVLTKARSAYLETWYLDSPSSETAGPEAGPSSSLDPRFYVQVESEIDLPPDILNCVEKLGEMSEMGFSLRSSLADGNLLDEVDAATADMILSDGPQDDSYRRERALTYLDLDSATQALTSSSPDPPKTKRRRAWTAEPDADETDSVPEDKFRPAKRVRFSSSATELYTFRSLEPSPSFNAESTALDPFFTSFTGAGNKFRTKKAHFEVDEEEEEDDSFLEDDEEEMGWGQEREFKNDRRVPSSNGSSSSSSDEEVDGVSAMEVDKLTSLVQYFSVSPSPAGSPPKAGGLTRSVSSPDLCSRATEPSASSAAQELSLYKTTNHKHFQSMKV